MSLEAQLRKRTLCVLDEISMSKEADMVFKDGLVVMSLTIIIQDNDLTFFLAFT